MQRRWTQDCNDLDEDNRREDEIVKEIQPISPPIEDIPKEVLLDEV